MDLGPIDPPRVLVYELRLEIGAVVRKIDAEVPACMRAVPQHRPTASIFPDNYRVVAGGRTIFNSF
jgi:hypothetical protein